MRGGYPSHGSGCGNVPCYNARTCHGHARVCIAIDPYRGQGAQTYFELLQRTRLKRNLDVGRDLPSGGDIDFGVLFAAVILQPSREKKNGIPRVVRRAAAIRLPASRFPTSLRSVTEVVYQPRRFPRYSTATKRQCDTRLVPDVGSTCDRSTVHAQSAKISRICATLCSSKMSCQYTTAFRAPVEREIARGCQL